MTLMSLRSYKIKCMETLKVKKQQTNHFKALPIKQALSKAASAPSKKTTLQKVIPSFKTYTCT